jgi:chromosome segregation ATPase
MLMEISADIRERIIAAAEKLFEESGRQKFPAVDQVRRLAKADMNTTSAVMKEWRRKQTAASGAVAIEIPARIQEVFNGALAEAWQEALVMTNETLNAAQQTWESERQEGESLRSEMAEAFELQAQELEDAKKKLAAALDRMEIAEKHREEQAQELVVLRAEKAQKDKEVEQLTSELSTVKKNLDKASSELVKVQAKAEVSAGRYKEVSIRLDSALRDMEEEKTRSKEELRKSMRAAADAREQVAGLTGQLEAIKAHNRELMAAFKGGSTE